MKIIPAGWSGYGASAYGVVSPRIPQSTNTSASLPVGASALSLDGGIFTRSLAGQMNVAAAQRIVAAQSLTAGTSDDWASQPALPNSSMSALTSETDVLHGSELTQATAAFAVQVNQAMRTHGISVPPEPVLSLGNDGAVHVVNAHPEAARLESILRSQGDLHERFAQLTASLGWERTAGVSTGATDPFQRVQGTHMALSAQQAQANAQALQQSPLYMRIGMDGAETFFGMPRGIRA